MILYINFFTTLPPSPQQFHGGGNYSRNIIREIAERNISNLKVVILCPHWYEVTPETELVFTKYAMIEWKKVDEVNANIRFEEGSILWFPILSTFKDFKELVDIKKNNPKLKVCATVHDLRTLDFVWDPTEKYYFSGLRKVLYPLKKVLVDGMAIQLLKRPKIKKCLKTLDSIYTVSNYAMQDIVKLCPDANVSWYFQSTLFRDISSQIEKKSDEFILFVSGARTLKNFTHALRGFVLYKKKYNDRKLKLIVTGISDECFKNICEMPELDMDIVNSYVNHMQYVSNEELAGLYKNCRFMLYTSKMEGFGLPVLEAAFYGKTSIASNVTSIPEVLGAAVRYVSPMNDESIAEQIKYLCDDNNLRKYEKRIQDAIMIIRQRMDLEQNYFIDDLLESGK